MLLISTSILFENMVEPKNENIEVYTAVIRIIVPPYHLQQFKTQINFFNGKRIGINHETLVTGKLIPIMYFIINSRKNIPGYYFYKKQQI